MKSFNQIRAAYVETDRFIVASERAAIGAGARSRWAILRQHNDQAYYVTLFAQFEQFIDAQCGKLIRAKRQSKVWKNRRLWDSTDIDRLQFMRKVGLLTEKGGAHYNLIDSYYDLRCEIAHGTTVTSGSIAVPLAILRFQQLAKDLKV